MSDTNKLPNAVPANRRDTTSPDDERNLGLSPHLEGLSSSFNNRSIISNRSERPSSISQQSEIAADDPTLPDHLPEEQAAKAIKNYLVSTEEVASIHSLQDNEPESEIYSASHTLQGGSITRDIYKFTEKQETSTRMRRALSFHDIFSPTNEDEENEDFQVGDILKPGGFRRHFVLKKAIDEGRDPPNFLTRSFIDFLALYGHFAGEDYPSDEDDDSEEDGFISAESGLAYFSTVGTASSQKCFFLLMKSFVGTGVLFLPRSFYNGGMMFSTITLLVVAYLALYCMLLLVECHHLIGGSFGDIGKKLYGRYARYAVMVSIILSQLGFCCAYTIFVAKNLKQLITTVSNCEIDLPESAYIFGQLIVYIPMAMVRKIKYFSMAALIADVFILAGLGYIYYFDINKILTEGIAPIQNFNSDSFALMIGTAIFTFEGIGLVLPIAESSKEPRKFPMVLSWTVAISAFIFTSVAMLCYATFGDKVDAVVLLNLPRENRMVQGVQLLYSLAITFSVPLQLFPALRILESGLFSRSSGKTTPLVKWQKNLFRTGLAIFFAVVAFLGSASLDNFVSLIGAFACVPLCFIYPAFFHYQAISQADPARIAASPVPISAGPFQKIKDLMLAAFGIIMMFYVTYITITTWSSPETPVNLCA
ncbi:hypothetical protein K502DRAFT_312334 [Neoconidiobolus thromboides FSU 785]|nr:hypothetical protein K502DRAFT_312334 [Neoconidiobolus thromboides FSU 785]